MILKKITAAGFKSFADKMELTFGAGITCIVGPNGCGKSNVVDAIKWVLGEQSAKSLRGKQMMDVVFNGSGTRKPAGMVQVDLTFDNSDGTLPTDQTEVVVSRRLYRSGESEYLLNKQSCRLKDVRELFLDTGIGVDAYSVIEQGRVDVLLQANPTDRRAIFEEAAGINKYKMRKKEALRRLERVDQNLQRLQDIVEEVEKRLRSVKLAAGKARNYQAYSLRLRELRSRYALSEYHRLRSSGDELDREIAGLSDKSTALRTELSNTEARESQANVRIVDLEREISEAEGRLLTVQSEITAHQERAAAAERRIEDQSELLDRSRERLSAFEDQTAALDARIGEQKRTAESVATELAAAHDRLASMQEQDRISATELHDGQRRLEDEKSGIIDLLRRTSQLRNEIQTVNIQNESLTAERAKLDARDAAIAQELAESMAGQQQLQTRLTSIDELLGDQRQKIEDTQSRLSAVAEQRARLGDQHAAAKEYRGGLESRRQLLEEMDRKHEGLLSGARELLARRDADESGSTFGYVRGALGELFDAELAHASIVEAVLGEHAKCLIVDSQDRLLADSERMTELGGRVEAFCLDRVPPMVGGPDLAEQEGFIAKLIDWVQYPADCERLARHLLGRTFVVESVESARTMSEIDPSARFVTMDGVVWSPGGRLGMGSLGSGSGMISRRSELRELAKNLVEVDARIADLARQRQESESESGHLETVQQELRDAMHETQKQRAEAEARLSAFEDVVKRLSDERPIIASEVSVIVDRLAEIKRKEDADRQTLTELERRSSESERMVAELQTALEALKQKRESAAEEITSLRVQAGELSERRSAVAETIRELEGSRVQLEAERDRANRDVIESQDRIDQSNRQIEQARATLSQLSGEREALTEKDTQLRSERDEQRRTVDQCGNDMRRLRGEVESVDGEVHGRQIKLQEIRVRQEDLVERVADELSVDLESQHETYKPDEGEDWPAVEAEIDELRGKIDRLGNVNLDAITEQEELATRAEFLNTQLTDLRESEKQLVTLIEKLNDESKKRFLETFTAVQQHFAALFKKLFGGGKAELILQDPDDVLECGIDITARPPGKEPQSISLLSGGEKTLTAIALLLAVMRSRPSPFVLMDEVDAALDEANNLRFNHVLEEFAKHSQFIVITHSKRTMSVADVMYGITMQEAGVSKRVSVRFEEERSAVA
ncbi:MAG: chromosome segregation protein SMC [Planctomycetota bacterium]|nr:chromosome segregation protein SMC [Planctomycetota bacterium]